MKDKILNFLLDLKRCGEFYPSAIELDKYVENPFDGLEFEKRLNELIKLLKNTQK